MVHPEGVTAVTMILSFNRIAALKERIYIPDTAPHPLDRAPAYFHAWDTAQGTLLLLREVLR
jgi:hypothetical protein